MSPEVNPRDFGRLEAKVETLQAQVAALSADLKLMISVLDNAKGGWRVLAAVGVVSSGITTWLISVMPFWPFR